MPQDDAGLLGADAPSRLPRVEVVLSSVKDGDDVDLLDLLSALWKQRWLIAAVVALFAALSLIVSLRLPNKYTATAILTPATASGSSALGRLANQYGGLASLAGITLGGTNEQDKSVLAVELAKTWGFLEAFIHANHIEPQVFAATGWNRQTRKLRMDRDLYDVASGKWAPNPGSPAHPTKEPTSWELYSTFSRFLTITRDTATGIVTLSITYYSPDDAKDWVDKLVIAINDHLRQQDLREARRSIAYLNQQIQSTSLTEMRAVFYKLIEEQTKNLMLAEISDEYVLKTLSPAQVPEKKSGPPRTLICIGGAALGLLIALSLGMLNIYRRRAKEGRTP